jgi:hypothetical protein
LEGREVDYEEWMRVERYEEGVGREKDKVREKVVDREEMLRISKQN